MNTNSSSNNIAISTTELSTSSKKLQQQQQQQKADPSKVVMDYDAETRIELPSGQDGRSDRIGRIVVIGKQEKVEKPIALLKTIQNKLVYMLRPI
jgi:hypothetical protein